jgi:hypothetical protein
MQVPAAFSQGGRLVLGQASEVPIGGLQHEGSHHLIVLMPETMAVVNESGELGHLVFGSSVEVLGVGVGDVEIGRGPSDSQVGHCEFFEKGDLLPSPFVGPDIVRDIITDVFVLIIEGAIGVGGVSLSIFFSLDQFKDVDACYLADVGLFDLILGPVGLKVGHHLRDFLFRHRIQVDTEFIVGQVIEFVELGESEVIELVD